MASRPVNANVAWFQSSMEIIWDLMRVGWEEQVEERPKQKHSMQPRGSDSCKLKNPSLQELH